MCRTTFTSIECIPLDTPYGAVKVRFESREQCVVLLPDEYTEPPTEGVKVDGVEVWGSLVFKLYGRTWEFQSDDERSRCYETATDCWVSEVLRDTLVGTLSRLLGEWCRASPEALEAVYRTLDEQRVARLEAEIKDLDNHMRRLAEEKAERQALIKQILTLRKYADSKL